MSSEPKESSEFRAVLVLPEEEGRGVLFPVLNGVVRDDRALLVSVLTIGYREDVKRRLITVGMNGGKRENGGGHSEVSSTWTDSAIISRKKGLSEDPETESTDKGFGQQILGFGEGSVLGRLRLNFKRWSGGKQADADKRAVFREVGRVHPAMAISMITRSLPIDRRCRV